jgi:prepilin-type N-terminal cleavage/methylation domain-containing protein
MQLIVFRDEILNPPIPPLQKGDEGGLFTKGGITDKTGLTLVEVLIALVIVLVVFLALMQTALVSIDSNMRSVLRDGAVGIAEDRMNVARNQPFDSLASGTSSETVLRNFRNITNFSYAVTRTVADLNSDNKQVDIRVQWTWKGETYTHSITTILRRQ